MEILRISEAVVGREILSLTDMVETTHDVLKKIQDIHGYKLLKIKEQAFQHKIDCLKIKNIVKNTAEKCSRNFADQIKESLKAFSAKIGKLELMQIRSLKKIKKNYRDFLSEELDNCYERLEESEASLEKVDGLMQNFNKGE